MLGEGRLRGRTVDLPREDEGVLLGRIGQLGVVVVRQRADASDALQRRGRRLMGGIGGEKRFVWFVPRRWSRPGWARSSSPRWGCLPQARRRSPSSARPHRDHRIALVSPTPVGQAAVSPRHTYTHDTTRHTPRRTRRGGEEGGGQVRCRCSGPSPRRGGSRWRAGGRRGRAPCRCSSC